MLPLIAERRSQIADICRRFGVRRLAVFGSAARGQDFDPERSDVDFLVAFEPAQGPSLGNYLALRDALAAAVGRHDMSLARQDRFLLLAVLRRDLLALLRLHHRCRCRCG